MCDKTRRDIIRNDNNRENWRSRYSRKDGRNYTYVVLIYKEKTCGYCSKESKSYRGIGKDLEKPLENLSRMI